MAQEVIQIDSANKLYIAANAKDEEFNSLFSKIEEGISTLTSDIPLENKYRLIVSVEYIFVRARFLVESEHIKVKQLLTSPDTPASLKPFFTKRDVYLSQVSSKLTTIQTDLSVLQKIVYTYNIKP